jgi:hypothetical protein
MILRSLFRPLAYLAGFVSERQRLNNFRGALESQGDQELLRTLANNLGFKGGKPEHLQEILAVIQERVQADGAEKHPTFGAVGDALGTVNFYDLGNMNLVRKKLEPLTPVLGTQVHPWKPPVPKP